MYILAGDTTGKTSSVAILQDDKILVEINQYLGLTHSETFFPMIVDALKQARLTISAIDLFSCTTGPGSFTGTRIGVTAMKTLAFTNQKELLGIDTLQAMSEPYLRLQKDAVVCSALAARNRRVFSSIAHLQCKPQEASVLEVEPWLASMEFALASSSLLYLVGDGYLELNKEELRQLQSSHRIIVIQSAFVSAAAIGRLAYRRYREGERADIATLQPNYLVVTQAERTTGISYETSSDGFLAAQS